MMNFEMLDTSGSGTVIKVVGVGGAGGIRRRWPAAMHLSRFVWAAAAWAPVPSLTKAVQPLKPLAKKFAQH